MQDYDIELAPTDRMLLDVMMRLKAQDDTLTFRRSCREGVCGSDAMNINGRNGLACITQLCDVKEPVDLRPLPGFPVIRDLVVDLTQFFAQYHSIEPYVVNDEPAPERERLQSPEDRAQARWPVRVHPVRVLHDGLSIVLVESGQVRRAGRIAAGLSLHRGQPGPCHRRSGSMTLDDPYQLFRCRSIMNCTEVCPKGLAPSRAIEKIRLMMVKGTP